MAVSINSNISSLQAQRRLTDSTRQLLNSFTKLSSGLRINKASDDAAGLAIGSNLITEVRQLKTQRGPDIVLSGSSTITSTLLEHGVVDEVWLAVYPILLGAGKRFFAEGTAAVRFELSSTQAFPSGIVLNRYDVKM